MWLLIDSLIFRLLMQKAIILASVLSTCLCLSDTFKIPTCTEDQLVDATKIEGSLTIDLFNFTEIDQAYISDENYSIYMVLQRQFVLKLSKELELKWIYDAGVQYSHYLDIKRIGFSSNGISFVSDNLLIEISDDKVISRYIFDVDPHNIGRYISALDIHEGCNWDIKTIIINNELLCTLKRGIIPCECLQIKKSNRYLIDQNFKITNSAMLMAANEMEIQAYELDNLTLTRDQNFWNIGNTALSVLDTITNNQLFTALYADNKNFSQILMIKAKIFETDLKGRKVYTFDVTLIKITLPDENYDPYSFLIGRYLIDHYSIYDNKRIILVTSEKIRYYEVNSSFQQTKGKFINVCIDSTFYSIFLSNQKIYTKFEMLKVYMLNSDLSTDCDSFMYKEIQELNKTESPLIKENFQLLNESLCFSHSESIDEVSTKENEIKQQVFKAKLQFPKFKLEWKPRTCRSSYGINSMYHFSYSTLGDELNFNISKLICNTIERNEESTIKFTNFRIKNESSMIIDHQKHQIKYSNFENSSFTTTIQIVSPINFMYIIFVIRKTLEMICEVPDCYTCEALGFEAKITRCIEYISEHKDSKQKTNSICANCIPSIENNIIENSNTSENNNSNLIIIIGIAAIILSILCCASYLFYAKFYIVRRLYIRICRNFQERPHTIVNEATEVQPNFDNLDINSKDVPCGIPFELSDLSNDTNFNSKDFIKTSLSSNIRTKVDNENNKQP